MSGLTSGAAARRDRGNDVVAQWTGRLGLALAQAKRLSRERFALALGISPRAAAEWVKDLDKPLGLLTQQLLDTELEARTSEAERKRFAELLRASYAPESAVPGGTEHCLVEAGARYQRDAARAVELLDHLAAADFADEPAITRASWIPAVGHGLVVGYLFGGYGPDDASVMQSDADLGVAERIRSTVQKLATLDFEHGGGHVRRMLLTYFTSEVVPRLRASCSERERRERFSAGGVVAQQLGWSAYDDGRYGAAQFYCTQGLRLGQEANDHQLCAYILGDLSHQANYFGYFDDAIELARAAQTAGRGKITNTQMASLLAMEARGHASQGEKRLCIEVYNQAERVFERRGPGATEPFWLGYFTQEELAGEAAHCFRDLGMPKDARKFAALSVGSTTPTRTRVFVDMVDAQATVNAGALDEALASATKVVPLARSVESRRCRRYVGDFARLVSEKHGREPAAKAFLERLRHGEWRQNGRHGRSTRPVRSV